MVTLGKIGQLVEYVDAAVAVKLCAFVWEKAVSNDNMFCLVLEWSSHLLLLSMMIMMMVMVMMMMLI